MNDKASHARQWLAKADSDLLASRRLLESGGLAQCLALPPMAIASGLEALDLSDLTPFAVEARYDIEFWPERVEAEAAVATAVRVCAAVARIIGS